MQPHDLAHAHRVLLRRLESAFAPTFEVSNTGVSISPDEVERLYEPFQTLDADRAHRSGGHGLGLSIVHAIASTHGAALRVRSRPEGGLDVQVRFPASSVSEAGSC